MTLLDRFRAQSRQKHPDPAVRLAYVEELPLEERDAIFSIAREDEDPRVRKAAVAKLMDPAGLSQILAIDADEGVRDQAAAMLRDIALDAFEGVGEAQSLDAVDALNDPRALAQVAKTAGREIVALRALSRITDSHALGSIARHGAVETVRRGAFDMLRERADRGELIGVAMNGEHKDTAVAAVDLLADRAELDQIAARSKNRGAVKRARTLIREAEERAARDAAEAERARAVEMEQARQPDAADTSVGGVEADEPSIDAERARAAQDAEREQQETERRAIEDADRKKRELEAAERARIQAEESARLDAERRQKEDAERAAARESEMRTRREGLARLQQLLARLEPLGARPDATLKAVDRAVRDVRAALEGIPPLPSRKDFDDVSRRFKAVQALLQTKAQELREADDWQRWANAGIQEQLCVKMEALGAVEDPEAIARDIRELQQQWRQASNVPRAKAEVLWHRFKSAHDKVWPRCEAHFAAQTEERAQNFARKVALCEQVEGLAGSTRWIHTAEEIKRLQGEWKTVGAVSRGQEKAIWDRFRTACDRFFKRRHDDLAQRKALWVDNLSKKEALCVQAEAFADSTDWQVAAGELKRLQAEWKAIGPVKQTRSEAIWQRFRGACDRFFTRYAQRHDTVRAERVAAREAICAELELLGAASDSDAAPAEDVLSAVRSLRGRWQQEIAARGVDVDQARALDVRFRAAFARVLAARPSAFAGTDLDYDANRKRMELLVGKVEELARSVAGPAGAADAALSPATKLAAMLKEALAANTIGGKVDEDSRRRAAMEEVRQAQASWSRIGFVPDDARRALAGRFERACLRITGPGRAGEAGGPGRTGGTNRAGEAGKAGKPGR